MLHFLAKCKSWYAATFPDAVRLANENLDLITQRDEIEEELRESREINDGLSRDNLRLQDRCEVLEGDRKEMWAMIRECQAELSQVHKSNENAHWQQKGYGVRWPDAPSIQHSAEPSLTRQSGSGSRILPSDMERKKTTEFIRHYTDEMAKKLAHVEN